MDSLVQAALLKQIMEEWSTLKHGPCGRFGWFLTGHFQETLAGFEGGVGFRVTFRGVFSDPRKL